MKLYLKRLTNGQDYTAGQLYIDNKKFCDTLEPADRLPADTYSVNLSDLDK
jgi:hypothetical protein